MDTQIQNQLFKFTTKKIILISTLAFILIMSAVIAQLAHMILSSDKIYTGVYVNNTDIGNLTKEQATKLLMDTYQKKIGKQSITLKYKNDVHTFTFASVKVTYDIPATIENAYHIGRNKNFLQNLIDIFNVKQKNSVLALNVTFHENLVKKEIKALYDKTLVPVKNANLIVNKKSVSINTGHHGESIDLNAVFSEVKNIIKSGKGSSIKISVLITKANKINVDKFYNMINSEPKNATSKVVKKKLVILSEQPGRSISKADLTKIINNLNDKENATEELPVVFKAPSITKKDITSRLFKDTLYTKGTPFNTYTLNNQNRANNIRIAASNINGTILAPGQVFSYNKTVGPRTSSTGFKEAFTYTNSGVIPGIGGGICQVSSTLYYAVLCSDLQVVERRNHRYTVTYVPLGLDATVSYGSTDFKFKNSTKWPLKIKCWIANNNMLYFSLVGFNDNPDKTISLTSSVVSSTPYSRVYYNDPALPAGQVRIKHVGYRGYVVNSYKITKIGGKIVSKKKISTSVYQHLDEQVYRGTKKLKKK